MRNKTGVYNDDVADFMHNSLMSGIFDGQGFSIFEARWYYVNGYEFCRLDCFFWPDFSMSLFFMRKQGLKGEEFVKSEMFTVIELE